MYVQSIQKDQRNWVWPDNELTEADVKSGVLGCRLEALRHRLPTPDSEHSLLV